MESNSNWNTYHSNYVAKDETSANHLDSRQMGGHSLGQNKGMVSMAQKRYSVNT